MKSQVADILEKGKVADGFYGSDKSYGLTGMYEIAGPSGAYLRIIADDGRDSSQREWEHVSVSVKNRCPNWTEMCFVKGLFWKDEECVVQFHPPKSKYVNDHPYCLHLWRYLRGNFPLPPTGLVGVKK